MRRRSLLVAAATTGALSVLPKGAQATANAAQAFPVLDSLAMPVSAEENRQYSFTDKGTAYFYGRTHQDKPDDWFFGWNVATKRIFQDYRLTLDGKPLLRAGAKAVVSPHAITRDFGAVKETLRMFDGLAALMVEVESIEPGRIGFEFTGDLLSEGEVGAEGVWYRPKEAPESWLLLAPIEGGGQGFFILIGATMADVRRLLSQLRRNHQSLTRARMARMEALVSGSRALDAGDPDRTKALLWMRLTADQLVMKQMGTGIYAGLPWFNDYWGRDTFISITGTLFVTGQYDVAADVFRSFAALQDTDPKSKTYGRIPNRARPDGVQYNTADGTPRFIITLMDLVRRSGNDALAKELWPTVKRAVEGVLANNVDEHGLITHDDADTWMDAKEKGARAFSPRGNRAIDIQALWLRAFDSVRSLVPAYAKLQPTTSRLLDQCRLAVGRLEEGLRAHFIEPDTGRLIDHIKVDGTKDTKLRPNILFALPEIYPARYPNDLTKHKIVKDIWEGLVYPWGVATLSQDDPDFYPYHEHWHYYHKDAAYHNGTVWPWLNGAAMDAILDVGVTDLPWQLFENMNRQALKEGAVGSLAECADALPLSDVTWTRRTGTFLQAWSNAEHLRIWHERFLGLSISALDSVSVTISPSLPQSVANVSASVPVGQGILRGIWHNGANNKWSFEAVDTPISLFFNKLGFLHATLHWFLESGQRVEIEAQGDSLVLSAYSAVGALMGQTKVLSDQVTLASSAEKNGVPHLPFPKDEIQFCEPRLQPNLKSLAVYHDPPLTY